MTKELCLEALVLALRMALYWTPDIPRDPCAHCTCVENENEFMNCLIDEAKRKPLDIEFAHDTMRRCEDLE